MTEKQCWFKMIEIYLEIISYVHHGLAAGLCPTHLQDGGADLIEMVMSQEREEEIVQRPWKVCLAVAHKPFARVSRQKLTSIAYECVIQPWGRTANTLNNTVSPLTAVSVTGVSFSHCACKVYSAAATKLLQPCPTLCDPMDCSPPGSPVPGILQARALEWAAISFSSA